MGRQQRRKQAAPVAKSLVSTFNTVDALGNRTIDASTHDSFVNFAAKLGIQANNLSSQGRYAMGPFISRNRLELEASYRSSWLVGRVVDCVAEDMTKAGVDFYSTMKPGDIQELQVAMSTFGVWHDVASAIKWARLYGGAVAVMLIDGADYEKPLNIETIGKNKFKGLIVLDRWMLQPSMGELITDLTKDIGKPKFYEVLAGVSTFPAQKIHYSRVLRFEGIELPYYQKLFENLWGLSVVERMLDRLMAFDSATTGAAQLLYRSYLRVIGVKGFREALAQGGRDENAVIKQFQYIRLMQNNEGITVLDSEDSFDTHQYAFSGISDLLQQFGQQISGAVEIPLVRLFGQSPTGFSTGDTDLRNYYDQINKLQENQLRPQLDKLLAVIARSELSSELPEDFEFKFISLWQMSDQEKATIAQMDSTTIAQAHDAGMISKATALKELLQQSRITGRFTNITEEDITDAENEAPPGMPPDTMKDPGNPEDLNDKLGGQDPEMSEEKPKEEKLEEEAVSSDATPSLFKRLVSGLRRLNKQVVDSDFKEEEHSRKDDGKFTAGSGSGGSEKKLSKGGTHSSQPTEVTKLDSEGKRVTASGEPLPENIVKAKIPPAWTEVVYNPDPEGALLVKGKDKKGEYQYLYSEAHKAKQAEAKFARIDELNKKYPEIAKQNQENFKVKKEEAIVLALIMDTGIRPGSDEDHKTEKKAYGATTLEGRHVEITGDKVLLHFVGKKGVELKIPVTDPAVAKMVVERKKKAGDDGRLFGTSDDRLLKYSSSLDGGGFITKDFRTLIATKTAISAVKAVDKPPSNEKEYKKMVMSVGKIVAEKLGNTASVALKSYIHPVVFQGWKSAIS